MNSALLEKLIEAYRFVGTHDPDRERQTDAFCRMAELIAERAPETVERTELEKGLRA